MLQHNISVHRSKTRLPPAPKGNRPKFLGECNSEEHKKFIYERCLSAIDYKIGDAVLYKRNPYTVVDVYEEYGPHVEWDHLKPLFIEVGNPSTPNTVLLVHPSDLKRPR